MQDILTLAAIISGIAIALFGHWSNRKSQQMQLDAQESHLRLQIKAQRDQHQQDIAEQRRRYQIERLESLKHQIIETGARVETYSMIKELSSRRADLGHFMKDKSWLVLLIGSLKQDPAISSALEEYHSQVNNLNPLSVKYPGFVLSLVNNVIAIIQRMIDEA